MEISIKNNQRLIKANHPAIGKVLRKALNHLTNKGCHELLPDRKALKHVEVSVLLVNDDGMRRLNGLHRGIDRTTDVLSFPQLTAPFPPGVSDLFLGDIVISLPQAGRQAKEYGTTFNREVGRLLVHGLLHLLGYDHEINSYQAAKMRRLESELAEVLCL
ncbi:MAG: rRNA maturation RNase YbeY [Nitrospirae bacterium]|nr:rRNA maturation RNase YbeY [Nitrospirota bacterium]